MFPLPTLFFSSNSTGAYSSSPLPVWIVPPFYDSFPSMSPPDASSCPLSLLVTFLFPSGRLIPSFFVLFVTSQFHLTHGQVDSFVLLHVPFQRLFIFTFTLLFPSGRLICSFLILFFNFSSIPSHARPRIPVDSFIRTSCLFLTPRFFHVHSSISL